MIRFLIIFAVTLTFALALMAGLLAQNGYSLFAPEMLSMVGVCFAVALYVSWRISNVLQKRRERREDEASLGGALVPTGGGSSFRALFGGKSRAQLDREARFAAKKRRLIQEGKIDAEATDGVRIELEPEPEPEPVEGPVETSAPVETPVRVSASASVKDKMAARRERVRRAREEGKI